MTIEEIEKIFDEWEITEYTINPDLSVNVHHDIDFGWSGIKEFPLNFKSVDGDFNCNNNRLTSLKGCPEYVSGDFSCNRNKLTDLKYGPKRVSGTYYCHHNRLTSLEGSPEKVHRFYCNNNNLTDLKGGPKLVKDDFECDRNELTSLEGSPEYVGGDFYCRKNKLKNLKGSPKKIGSNFVCSNNRIWTLDEFDCEFDFIFICDKNPLGRIFDEVDIDFIKMFKSCKVIKEIEVDGSVKASINLKRLKYAMSIFNMPIDLDDIKMFYNVV